MYVGEAEVAALVLERQSFMVDAEQMQQRRVKVVHMDAVLDDVVAVVVGLADDGAALRAAAGHSQREAAAVVITPKVILTQRALAVVGAAKLAAPDHQRVVEHPALL